MQQVEDPVQVVNCEHFPNTGVMIEDYRRHSVAAANEIAHASLGPTNEFCVAENHPGSSGAETKGLQKVVNSAGTITPLGATTAIVFFRR